MIYDLVESIRNQQPFQGRYIVHLDMDGVLADFDRSKIKDKIRKYPQSREGFFLELDPINGAIDTVSWMMDQSVLDVHVLTAPSVKNPHSYSEKRLWIEKYFGMDLVRKMIISPSKQLVIGHFLVDDYATGKGQELFMGTHLHFGTEGCPHWEYLKKYFSNLITNMNS